MKSEDVFGDLLGSQGYQFAAKKDNAPRTINEMRKEEVAKDMDPEKLKIMEWVRYPWEILIDRKIVMMIIPDGW